jgi:tetratricopeptide (TPR) repeat protein
MSRAATVYYVRFGGPNPGMVGRRATDNATGNRVGVEEVSRERDRAGSTSTAPGRTMSNVYSQRDVSRLFNMTTSRLQYWDKSGFLSPSGHNGRHRCYTFQDLIAIRSVKTLLDNGISLQRTRRILAKLKEALPRTSHPLGRLRIMADAKTVIVTDVERDFEADTGQLLLDFDVKSLESQVAALPSQQANSRHMSAYEWYLEGCRLDECEETLYLAEQAYHRAIHMDPTLANAYTNLGNLLYRTGGVEDAKALYKKAIEVDVNQPEAHYNLGFLEFDAGRFKEAEGCFSRAIELDNTFADAHFNLAITCFRLGKTEHAELRLKTYLSLDPEGPWAETARQRLEELSR